MTKHTKEPCSGCELPEFYSHGTACEKFKDQQKDKIVAIIKRHRALCGPDFPECGVADEIFATPGVENPEQSVKDLVRAARKAKARLEFIEKHSCENPPRAGYESQQSIVDLDASLAPFKDIA